MKMKIGGANFPYARAPFERFLDDMVELEIQDVDLYSFAPHLYLEDATPADLAGVSVSSTRASCGPCV